MQDTPCIKKILNSKSPLFYNTTISYLNLFYDKNFKHKCLDVAFDTMFYFANQGLNGYLVHANINIENKKLGHAWFEFEDIIVDMTLPPESRLSLKEHYFENLKYFEIMRYSAKESYSLYEQNNGVFWEDWFIFQN